MTTSDWVRGALAWLATYGLHSTLFLGAAWLLCRLRPPRVNRDRERLWKLAMVGGIVSASLQIALGARPLFGRIDWHPLEVGALAADAPAQPAPLFTPSPAPRNAGARKEDRPEPRSPAGRPPVGASTSRAEGARTPSQERPAPVRLAERPAAERSPSAATPAQVAPAPLDLARKPTLAAGLGPALDTARTRWPGLVLALWTALGLVGLVGLFASWTLLRRNMLGRELLRTGPLLESLERLRRRAQVRRRVRLSVSDRLRAPFSLGLVRPEICVPRAVLTDLTRAQQEALLAHELAHLVRRDPLWFLSSTLIEKVFFFQPLNRLARRQLTELAEVACDDWAVRWTGARLALASCLTEVAGWVIGEKPRRLALPGLARSPLGQRVQRLLDDRRSPAGEPPAPWWPPLAAVALALTALALPGVSATPKPAARTTPSAAARTPAAPPPAFSVAAGAPLALAEERAVLEAELALLEAELSALRAELAARALSERFATALERIDARLAALREQHLRVQALLQLLNTPADGPPPVTGAPSPVPTADLGEAR